MTQTSHEALLKGRVASPERVARRLKIHRVQILHQVLQHLDYITSPDLILKETLRGSRLIRRRATYKTLATFYNQMSDKAPGYVQLFNQARDLYGQGMTEKQVAAKLGDQLSDAFKQVPIEPISNRIIQIGNAATNDILDKIGVKDKASAKKIASTIALLLGTQVFNDLLGAQDTYADRYARSAAEYAGMRGSEDVLQAQLRADLVWNKERSFGATASTEAGNAEGIPAHGVMEEVFEERRLITMDDERVCEDCLLDASQGWIAVDEDYRSGHSNPPIHVHCRCYEEGRTRREDASSLF